MQVGKYKSKDTNLEIQFRECKSLRYKSENASRNNTIMKIRIEKYRPGEYKFGKHTSNTSNREIQVGKVQIGKCKSN